MRDALGRVQSAVILGGGSDIGVAVAGRLVSDAGAKRVVLAGRNPDRFAATTETLTGASTRLVNLDATDLAGHETAFAQIFADGDIDVVLLAFGVLIRENGFDTDIDSTVEMLETNYVGAVAALLRTARYLARQGHGHIIVLSSIAGQRARPDNYLYGSTRAGIDFVARGMAPGLEAAGVRLSIIRPGFVHSKMTAGWKPAPFSVKADDVARVIVREVEHPSSTVVWVPPAMRVIAWILRLLPASLLRRLR
jgi:decaprenylphospho-beta-D-erythro-pentofuranosid-2-ulose 2-reductase